MITFNDKLITQISYGNENVEAIYKGNNKIWPIDMDGVIIDQTDTSDPDKIIKGETMNEELVSIAKNVHWYCGKLTEKGMLICQVGNNVVNFNPLSTNIRPETFYDGKTSTYTSMWNGRTNGPYVIYGDIFLRFPTFSVINDVIDENHSQLKWVYGVKVPGWVNWDDNWLIGLSSSEYNNNDGRFYCHEKQHSLGMLFNTAKSQLEDMNNMECMKKVNGKYGFFSYWQRCILTWLYWSFYGTTRDVLTGNPHYFFGIDAFCSNWEEFMDGIVVNNRVPTITRPDGTTRIGPTLPGTGGIGSGGWVSKIYLTPYLDILPKELNGASDKGFCSYIWTSSNENAIPRLKGGQYANGEIIGCGYDRTGSDGSGKAEVRMTYHGDIIETKDIEYFKRVKPINGGVYFDDETGQDEICFPIE